MRIMLKKPTKKKSKDKLNQNPAVDMTPEVPETGPAHVKEEASLQEMAFPSNYRITNKTSNKSLGKLSTRKDDLGRRARAELKRRLAIKAEKDKARAASNLERQKKKITKKSKQMGTPVKIISVKRTDAGALDQLQNVLSGSGNIKPEHLGNVADVVGSTDPKKLAAILKQAAKARSDKKKKNKIDRLIKNVEAKAAEKAKNELSADMQELRRLRAIERKEKSGQAAKEREYMEIIRKVEIAKKMQEYDRLFKAELISREQLSDIRTQLDAGVDEPVVRSGKDIEEFPLKPLKTINIANVQLPQVQTEPPASSYVAEPTGSGRKTGIINRLKGILRGKFFKESKDYGLVKGAKNTTNKKGSLVNNTNKLSKDTSSKPPINQKEPKITLPQARTDKNRKSGIASPTVTG